MLINFYCAIIKQSIDCIPLIGKQQWIRFYVGMLVITSLICLKIVKYMKLKVGNKCYNLLQFFSIIIYIYIYIYMYISIYIYLFIYMYIYIYTYIWYISSKSSSSSNVKSKFTKTKCRNLFENVCLLEIF